MSISIMASGWRYSSSFRDLGNSKGLSTTHVVNKNSEKKFYKEIVKCIKELEGIFTIWKLICELNGRNFLYIHFSAANFTYQFELDVYMKPKLNPQGRNGRVLDLPRVEIG